jgi:hypothetical protein
MDWITYFKTKPPSKENIASEKTEDNEIYIGALSFKITAESDIDVMCILPDLKNASTDQISSIAEKYADFLLAINEGYLKDDIVKIIQKKVDAGDDPKDTLFLENMLFYWALSHVESQKRKKNKEKKDQPVIRPISVFNRP